MANPDTQETSEAPVSDLRSRVVRGGAAIAVRQGLGMILSAVNLILVTRIIGPHQYGIFAAGIGIVVMISTAGTWGLDVYLLRKAEEPEPAEYNQAFTLFFATGLFFSAFLTFFRHGIAAFSGISELALPLAVISLYIPLNLLSVPGIVRLDRDLRFHRVGLIELIGQTSGYAVAIPLAFAHKGCWAPVFGQLTGQALTLIIVYASTPMRLRLHWNLGLARKMLSYGLSYSGAIWIWQLRMLVNPLVVGRFAGATGVGYVALAIRLVEVLSFIKLATWRVAMAALAKLDGNKERLRKSITEGMCLQAFMVGLPLTLFAGIAPFVLPHIFGTRWNPTFHLFPFLALSYLLNAIFNLHTSVLALIQRNVQIAYFHTAHVILFASSALVLVSRFGYLGYGWAEVVAFAGYYLLHRFLSSHVGSPDYSRALIWFLVCSICIVVNSSPDNLRVIALLLLPVPFLFPSERASLGGYAKLLMPRRNV
jgi:O-antigen/teichoic acid export membrane protein